MKPIDEVFSSSFWRHLRFTECHLAETFRVIYVLGQKFRVIFCLKWGFKYICTYESLL